MANVGALFSSLLGRLREIQSFKFVHIWNDQLTQLANGDTYVFPFPCAFVEIISPNPFVAIGGGYSVGDIIIRIHIGHEEYDAGSGNFEENVNVFTFRDAVINKFNNFQPTGGSSMMKISESQDYSHTNLYHYTIDFSCAFVDSVGSFDAQIPTETGVIETIETNVVIDYVNLFDKFDNTFDNSFQFYGN
jgi:hypothetical protein